MAISSVAFSPDGKRLASGSGTARCRLWDAGRRENRGTAQRAQRVVSQRGVQPGRQAAGLGQWMDQTGAAVGCGRRADGEPLKGHANGLERGVQPGRQAPGLGQWRQHGAGVGCGTGRTTASRSTATPVRCRAWRSARTASAWPRAVRTTRCGCGTRATGTDGEPLKGHSDWVFSVAFSPDGKRLASGEWRQDGAAVGCGDGHRGRAAQRAHERGQERGVQPGRQAPGLGE